MDLSKGLHWLSSLLYVLSKPADLLIPNEIAESMTIPLSLAKIAAKSL